MDGLVVWLFVCLAGYLFSCLVVRLVGWLVGRLVCFCLTGWLVGGFGSGILIRQKAYIVHRIFVLQELILYSVLSSWTALFLMMGSVIFVCPGMSVRKYQLTLCKVSEERRTYIFFFYVLNFAVLSAFRLMFGKKGS